VEYFVNENYEMVMKPCALSVALNAVQADYTKTAFGV
jgi:hypothetical protein